MKEGRKKVGGRKQNEEESLHRENGFMLMPLDEHGGDMSTFEVSSSMCKRPWRLPFLLIKVLYQGHGNTLRFGLAGRAASCLETRRARYPWHVLCRDLMKAFECWQVSIVRRDV